MKIYNVLVTGSSSYGVGEGIIKTINMSIYRDKIKLIGASNSNLTAYKDMVDKYYILPSAKKQSYLEKLNELIEVEKIDILIPGSEAEIEIISRNKFNFKNIDIWVNDYNLIELFNDKSKANSFLKKNNINTPNTFKNSKNEKIEYPLIVKPTIGKGSENIHIVRNEFQLKATVNLFKTYNKKFVIQQYIENGEEYTVSLINLSKNHIKTLLMKRILSKGATQYSYIEDDDSIEKIVLKIHELTINELILNIQIIKENDKYFVLEINPRFSGSSPMRAMLGFNEFDILFSNKYLDNDLECNLNRDNYIIRGYKEFSYLKQYN